MTKEELKKAIESACELYDIKTGEIVVFGVGMIAGVELMQAENARLRDELQEAQKQVQELSERSETLVSQLQAENDRLVDENNRLFAAIYQAQKQVSQTAEMLEKTITK